MASATLIWFLFIVTSSVGQKLSVKPNSTSSICKTVFCKSPQCLQEDLKDCIVILGNLELTTMEDRTKSDFANLSFPLLREVTGFVVVYRVQGLDSIGKLFPSLTRIRGEQLFSDYALIIFDMTSLVEVGLFSLRKIDRGGIIIQGLPQACYVDTIDWKAIAPRARRIIGSSDKIHKTCNRICTCSRNATFNHCWNIQKCQLYSYGSEDKVCNDQCLGCRDNNVDECATCRHFTYKGNCVPRCPNGTIVLSGNQYCITEEECARLDGWPWKNKCVFECPVDYIESNTSSPKAPKHCPKYLENCGEQKIHSLSAIEAAKKCVYINGSLEIHIRAIPEALKELRYFLSRIQEVSGYVEIYGSLAITTLDFLSSLRRIKGETLKNDKYSLLIYDMANLHTLFNPNVTRNLRIDRGTLKMYNNRLLCMSKVDELKQLMPDEPSELDILQDTNGYSGGCDKTPVDFQIRLVNETSAELQFSPMHDPHIHYTVLYVRLPPDLNGTVVPETCSDFQWYSVNVPSEFGQNGIIKIHSLRPASSYAVCIETYDTIQQRLARSSILNFTTPVGTPAPPFVVELVAKFHDVIVIRWVDHVDYRQHITRYELDVELIELKDVGNIDYCQLATEDFEVDYTRHALVMRPPPEYERACESMCGVLSSFAAGALVEDYFDVCSDFDFDCTVQEDEPPTNTTFKSYVKTLALNISSPKNAFQVAGLAPYRDYRFRLRACIGERCSRSARGVVRTMKSNKADIPMVTYGFAEENGHVTIKWDPPDSTNGPILSYAVEILPKFPTSILILPQTWCLSSDARSFRGSCVLASKYKVRVCVTSLASISTCSEWYAIETSKSVVTWYWWTGVGFGVFLYIFSTLIGILSKMRRPREDLVPIVDTASSFRNESEPPSGMALFVYRTMLLREAQFE